MTRAWRARYWRAAVVGCGLLWVMACRFERRPEVPDDGAARAASPPAGTEVAMSREDSVRAVLAALVEALATGDVARVGRLTTPDAVLIDQEEAIRWVRADPTGPLPMALTSGGPLAWQLDRSRILDADGSVLVVNEYSAAVSGESVPWTAIETIALARTPGGWRIRHLHRSRGPVTGEPLF